MIITFITTLLILTAYFFVLRMKRLKKLKNSIYEISSYSRNGTLRYYIVMEQSHGKFIDSRKLPKVYKRIMPEDARAIIEKSYDNESDVIDALQSYKSKMK